MYRATPRDTMETNAYFEPRPRHFTRQYIEDCLAEDLDELLAADEAARDEAFADFLEARGAGFCAEDFAVAK